MVLYFSYLGINLAFMYLDLTGKPRFLLKYKIQKDKNIPVSFIIFFHKIKFLSLISKTGSLLACLHDQNKSDFFGGPAFSNQSGHFENFQDCSDWPDKSRPSKKSTFVLIM